MNILVVGDLHAPFTHPDYLRFCKKLRRKYRTKHTVFIGDIVDNHALGFYTHDPNGMSAGNETVEARKEVQKWYKIFPYVDVCIGNHDARGSRVAEKAGLPQDYLGSYSKVWDTPTWNWAFEHHWDDVAYIHGTGMSGKDIAINCAIQRRESVVLGHTHSYAGIKWHFNYNSAIFGMNVGCGLDDRAYAFAYAKDNVVKSCLGAGVVLNGVGYFCPMLP